MKVSSSTLGSRIKPYAPAIAGGVVGLICGLVSHTSFLEGRWVNLIVWGLGGLGLGWFVQATRAMVWCGVVYGFVLAVTFLISGFQGSANNIPAFLILTLILSLF